MSEKPDNRLLAAILTAASCAVRPRLNPEQDLQTWKHVIGEYHALLNVLEQDDRTSREPGMAR